MFSGILKKIREKNRRKDVLRQIIAKLRIDETQRSLYFESLELLDDEGLSAFYHRLLAFVDDVECAAVSIERGRYAENIRSIRKKEEDDRRKEAGRINFLFDNV